jgi:glycosyltransferase involved in cell wall biosynthesis
MHTDIVDNAGTDLDAVCKALVDPSYVNIKLFPNKLSTEDMNTMYNASDGVILISSNEGWGLSLTEALNTGKMIIATVSGGMQDQMRFEDNDGNWLDFNLKFPSNHTGLFKKHGEWAIPVFPSNRSLCGSPATPYIYDDRASIEDIAQAIKTLYELSPEDRQSKGRAGYQWATGDEAGFTAKKMCARIVEGIEATFESFKKYPRSRYELYKVGDRPSELLNYNPVEYSYE